MRYATAALCFLIGFGAVAMANDAHGAGWKPGNGKTTAVCVKNRFVSGQAGPVLVCFQSPKWKSRG